MKIGFTFAGMKQNVTLKSVDRVLFGVTIAQETKTEMLSITDLQKAYDIARMEFGWGERRFDTITSTKDFRERIFYVLKELGVLVDSGIHEFTKELDKRGVPAVLKELGVYRVTGKGDNRRAMANPYLWMLIALEMNPMIYAKVVIWLTDTLILNRIEAGDKFRPMNTAIEKVVAKPDFYVYAIAINERVFGRHMAGMRNLASKEDLKKIATIEQFVAQAIDMGYVSTHDQIMEAIKNCKI